ncbi:MAG: DNA polymerase IV [Verrucomicrobia bacterium]|nr:DNA polymerase IV [Verrucomicrobiota bacterium]
MILHLDADAFFASVEQASDARLRRKPVAVGGSARGVVASASYEARRCGITSAMPVARARRLCPQLIVIPGDFEKYEHFSRMMFSYAYDFTPSVEVGSIDEGYADLGGNRKKQPEDIAAAIRRAVRETLRITLSGGVGANKLVSQVASKLRKPDALIAVPPGTEREFLAPLDNHWLPGIGPQLARTLREAGLPRITDIAATPPDQLSLFAGKSARALWNFAHGRDERPVVPESPSAKSYSEQTTFESDITDEACALAILRGMADRLFAKARAEGQTARTITVRIRYNDFDESTRSQSLDEPTDLETQVFGLIAALLRKAWERRVSLRLVSLKLGNLYKACLFQELDLFPSARNSTVLHRAANAVDAIRERHGKSAILRGHDLWLRSQDGRPRETLREEPPEYLKERGRPARMGKVSGQDARASVSSSPVVASPATHSTGRHEALARGCCFLNFRSCYSFMDSLLTPEKIVMLAADAGCEAVGICDPNLHAAVPFYQAAKAAGLRPLIGAELAVAGTKRCAYAQNQTGYANLCRLLSAKSITSDLWETHRDGLTIVSDPTPPIRMGSPSDARALRILQSIRTLTLFDEAHPEKTGGASFAEARPSGEIIESDFAFDFETLRFPRFDPPDACTPQEFLSRLAHAGLKDRYPSADHRAQLETELAIIAEVGYAEYFLTVWDLLQGCRRAGIGWITRGSAADSLVCYCLGISDVCPVRFELYFQRFLNRDRMALNKLPDIDVDFPHDRKDEVVDMLFRKHPPGHVAAVGGFNTFHARSALAEIAKVLGLSDHQARRLTEHLPFASARNAEEAAGVTTAAADGLFDDEPAKSALRLAALLDSLPRHAKIHPCGIVLSRHPIHELTPTFLSNKGRPATHFDMDAVEEVGLVKLDILAQGGLAVLRDATQTLAARGLPVNFDNRGPWNDPAVWDIIATGRARGVHHIESPAMTSLEKMCGCRDIDTLIAIVSVIRPGAANTLRKETFARRALGLEPPAFPHPSLEPCLRTTHGVIAYEEHILQIADAFASMPAGRADILRRALVKVQDAKIEEMRGEFFGFARRRGRTEEEIRAVWELVHGFRGYAFCRAHSTAYALEAWQAAWMKTYHPADFMAAILTHGKGFYSPLAYSLECRLLGIGFLPPDVNRRMPGGTTSFLPEGPNAIRVPVSAIKGLSEKLITLLKGKKFPLFASIADFADKTNCTECDLRLLLHAGAFDSLCSSRADGIWKIRKYIVQGIQMKRFDKTNFTSGLVDGAALSGPTYSRADTAVVPPVRKWISADVLKDEMELLGFTVSGHPLELWPDVPWETYCPIREIGSHANRRVTICGLVIADRFHQQSDGQAMKFLSLCDHTGMLETEMFADAFRRFGLETLRHPVLEITGTVIPFEGDRGFSLRIEAVRRPRHRAAFS